VKIILKISDFVLLANQKQFPCTTCKYR